MTTATTSIPFTTATRPTIEDLVDRLIDSIFGGSSRGAGPEPRALRPRRAAAAAGGPTSTGRWRSSPASTWRRRNRTRRAGRTPSGSTSHGGASATAGRSSTALTPDGQLCSRPAATAATLEVLAVLGMRWRPGQDPLAAQPAGAPAPGWSPRVTAVASRHPGRPRRPQAPPPPRRGGGRSGRRPSRQRPCPPGRLPLPRGARGQLHGVRRHRALVLLRLRRGRRRAGLHPARRGPEPARGDPAARRRPTDRCGQPQPPPASSRAGSLAGPGAADGGGHGSTAGSCAAATRRGRTSPHAASAWRRLHAWAWATRRGAGCGASLRAPASARSGSGTRGCSRSGASASPAWWSFPRSRAGACAGLRDGPSTRSGRPGSSRCPVPSPCSGWGGLAPPRSWAVVAEGVFDWLGLAQWGLPACAALGTQGLERVASALRGCPRVFLAFDNDEAGREAAARLGGLLGPRAATVALPAGVSDVAELAASSARTGRSSSTCSHRLRAPPPSHPTPPPSL